MEVLQRCAISSAPALCGRTVSSSIQNSNGLHRINLLCRRSQLMRRYHRDLNLQSNQIPLRFRLRAQAPSPHNDDNHTSREISSKDLGAPNLEVKRVEDSIINGPSKFRYGLLTGLAGVGLIETAYLTWMKLNGGPVSCPLGGTGCEDVLNSEYGTVFGVPLSLVGMAAYGVVTLLAARMLTNPKKRAIEEEGLVRWLLLASTTAMAVASGYFMYILNIKLDGASCTYCVGSALLSVSLLLSTLPGFSSKDLRNVAGVQLAVGASVAVALSVAFSDTNSAFARSGDIDLPLLEPEVSTVSSQKEINLAKHLKAIGARMYGAFWCSHCFEQKQMFGKEAMNYLDYVECYPEGYRRGVEIAKACEVANIQGFPSWIINDQLYSGEQEFAKLVELSGLEASKLPK